MTTTLKLAASTILAGLLLAGCSSKSDTASTTTTTVSVCEQAKTVQQAVQDLKNVDVVKNGTTAVSTAADTLKTDVEALTKAGKSQLQPEADNLKNAVDNLESALKSSSSGRGSVITAAAAVATAAEALQQKVASLKC